MEEVMVAQSSILPINTPKIGLFKPEILCFWVKFFQQDEHFRTG